MAISFGLMGIYLLTTIYLQSVLGMSALGAGLLIAISSTVSMLLAPFAGRLVDRIGGAYLLLGGIILFTAGMGYFALTAQPGSDWTGFLVPFAVAGVGLGSIFAPLVTTAMRHVTPPLAGAASSLLTTTRQLGSVVAGATVGALLQNRLAAALAATAERRSGALPQPYRARFVDGFRHSAGASGVGAHHATAPAPPGTPPDVSARLAALARDVFGHAYVSAFKVTVLLPIVVLLGAAACCLAVRERRKPPSDATAPDGDLSHSGG
jgi:MFS family permease